MERHQLRPDHLLIAAMDRVLKSAIKHLFAAMQNYCAWATKNRRVVKPTATTTSGQLEIVIGRFPFPYSQR